MSEPFFFEPATTLTVAEIARLTGAEPGPGAPLDRVIRDVATLDQAGPSDLAFLENPRYADALPRSRAGACLIAPRFAASAPAGLPVLTVRDPHRAFVAVARALYPSALRPVSLFGSQGVSPGASVHPAARLESGVVVDPGAVVGPGAEIGTGTVIGPTAVVGPGVRIGRDCAIGAGCTLTHALVGDRVIIHPGCRIGQDGFGYVMGAGGHQKVPQLRRVIIQNDVEIGAGTTIDRGGTRDTVIGEGTKIDNLVQIGHNVLIGRHCVIVAQTGISGSAVLEDYVVLGARAGVNNHVVIGEGAQVAAVSGVNSDIPRGERWGGVPAKPARAWMRELRAINRLAQSRGGGDKTDPSDDDRH
ncbi:UDP-3-O-(3-hydroxymyristoyl)glucosamine N-acyltransferase [Rhodoplanes sp. TEM]|uniref:UDP-3-O-acylglucosamine N-acyltransferase n=1 Tax=Rhodoplanes tepidamans TaxID=200616 RepID=A0ABT5JBI0_RHOTP|nr:MULTISPECIES: UDP-3-O-(3-hydroxymyristoyl)glucosamine N-acyltransferase [Rhodoplanes]MDC7786410.1 UDP-3-O-(3-hydroxymyristoyl)glucosamine N-acyltransferase [Rhodoplanes tepidamans]MDC7985748.1 UDP-3-O-(3-hydroxymyristoyl)glucosamine N-acyltransferase [Rhodoplanes sp. TEM]MDQ0357295.1 UDP-3-O-[3-hydroxymyristoyl] glucosamine N-acyltransferase [Rhodoplanes tepidamans]